MSRSGEAEEVASAYLLSLGLLVKELARSRMLARALRLPTFTVDSIESGTCPGHSVSVSLSEREREGEGDYDVKWVP